MATTFTSNSYGGRTLTLTINETTNAKTNKSTLSWTLKSAGGSANYYSIAETTVTINGTRVYHKSQTSWDDRVFPAATGSTSGTIEVTHNTDGTKSITVVFSTRVYYSSTVDYGGTMTLTKIDRTAPTVSLATSNITASGVTVKATASTTCDRWDYSTNGGTSWVNFSTTSGTTQSKAITGLSPNTTYSIKVRARKSSNEVYGNSAAASVKTLGGSAISSVNTLTADNQTAQIVISVTVYNTSYTHTLTLKNGSTTILTLSGLSLTSGSNTITLTSAQRSTVLSAMSSVKSFTGTFELKTYSGNTQIGTASTKTATIQTTAANSTPTFTGFTYSDTNALSTGVTGNNTILIQDISALRVQANAATAKNGATISGYSATAGSAAASSNNTTIDLGVIHNTGTIPLIVTVIDSRGYTNSTTVNIQVMPYDGIRITSCSMRRVNEVEERTSVLIEGDLSPITINGTNKNPFQYLKYRYRKTDAENFGSWVTISNVTYSDSGFSFSSNEWITLDDESSYYIQFIVADKMSSDTVTVTIPQGTPLLAFRKKKIGVNNRTPGAAIDIDGGAIIDGFKLPEIQCGEVDITPTAANTPTSVTVTFDKPFSGKPVITAAPLTRVPGTAVTGVGVQDITASGCKIYLTRTSDTLTTVAWIAMYNASEQ